MLIKRDFMVKEKKENSLSDWKFRVLNASSCELVVITYELMFECLEKSKICFDENNIEGFEDNVKKAQDFLMELMTNLNLEYELSLELMQLYIYANKHIIKAYSRKDISSIDEVSKILGNLFVAWEQLAQEEADKTPLMENTQQVYAGLTYGRGYLNESIANNENRGFKA